MLKITLDYSKDIKIPGGPWKRYLYTLVYNCSGEREEVELLPKRYRADNINALCHATGYGPYQTAITSISY